MKQRYLTIFWSMAGLAIFASPALGSSQKRLRGGKPLEKDDYAPTENEVATLRQHRVLQTLPGGRASVVTGKLGNLGFAPGTVSRE